MRTLLLIAILFATTITVAGVKSFTPSFVVTASAQNEEVVELEEGEVDEIDEIDEEEVQPEEESEYEPAYENGY